MNTFDILPSQDITCKEDQESDFSIAGGWPFDLFVSPEELYGAVFKNAFHPMFIATFEGQMVKFNEKCSHLFGYTTQEMYGMESSDLFETAEAAFTHFITQREAMGIEKAGITGIKKYGQRFPCHISSVIYESDNGEKRSMNTLVSLCPPVNSKRNA